MLKFRAELVGQAPLLMHNGDLANPMNEIVRSIKDVTAKRTKTEEDHVELARLEYMGGLHFIKDVGPYIPSDYFFGSLYNAAKMSKQGVNIKRALSLQSVECPLVYDGPKDIAGLWADENFRLQRMARVQTKRVLRTRPQFNEWASSFEGLLDTELMDLATFKQIINTAGTLIGIGDWRPQYGRFTMHKFVELGEVGVA